MISYLKKNHFLILTSALLAVLGIRQLVVPILILLVISWFFSAPISTLIGQVRTRLYIICFLIPFGMYLVGIIYSDNQAFGWKDIEVKLSLLIFPVLYGTTSFNLSEHKTTLFGSYIFGVLMVSMLSISNGFIETGHLPTYSELNLFLHPGYLALFMNLAIVFCLHLILEMNPSKKVRAILLLSTLFSSLVVWLSLSKTGILLWGIIMVGALVYDIIKYKRKTSSLILILGVIIVGMVLRSSSKLTGRFSSLQRVLLNQNEEVDMSTIESTQVRVLIWKQALKIIEEEPFWGTGTGDIKDELFKKYEAAGMTGALENKLNVHNQFLQVLATLGLIGFIVITIGFFLPLLKAIKSQNYLYLTFLFIVAISSMFESILERQDGVVFFALFNSLLFFHHERDRGPLSKNLEKSS